MTGVFIIPDVELQSESWRLMLRKESEEEKYEKKQKQIIEDIFNNY